jgi:hypothetical protein
VLRYIFILGLGLAGWGCYDERYQVEQGINKNFLTLPDGNIPRKRNRDDGK